MHGILTPAYNGRKKEEKIMIYVSGIHALNIPCSLETCGDWHSSALRWKDVDIRDSSKSIFGDYGIESGHRIPHHEGTYNVANTIRALLDLIDDGNFAQAQGMNSAFICNPAYDSEVFEKVYLLSSRDNWHEISAFMGREYRTKWLRFLKGKEKGAVSFSLSDQAASDEDVKRGISKNVHEDFMRCFLSFLNRHSAGYILKGGAALMLFYGLDRFSGDIDLDGTGRGEICAIAEEFCRENGCSFATEKDTPLTLVLLFSRDGGSTLRVTVSFRRRSLPCEDVTRIDGILVYGISTLCMMKTNAYLQKERMRDLFDLSFIVSRYSDALSAEAFDYAAEAISYRGGSEQLEYIIATQRDSLVDKKAFARIFKEAVRILGVVSDTDQA